jgi:hypothetical protein
MIQHMTHAHVMPRSGDDQQANAPATAHPTTQHTSSPRRQVRRWSILLSLAAGFLVPFAVYFLVRPHVGSDAVALAIGGAIPTAWTLVRLLWQRRLDPIGVLAVLGFGVELLVAVLTRGNAFALKLQEAPLTGAFGLVCLVSVAIQRPLLPTVLRFMGLERAAVMRKASLITLVIGATFLIDALVRVVLAATLATNTFVAVSREVNWAILGLGILVLVQVRRSGTK